MRQFGPPITAGQYAEGFGAEGNVRPVEGKSEGVVDAVRAADGVIGPRGTAWPMQAPGIRQPLAEAGQYGGIESPAVSTIHPKVFGGWHDVETQVAAVLRELNSKV